MALRGPETQVIVLGSRTLLPGLVEPVEPHMHFVFTFFGCWLDLGPFANRSMDEVKPMVQEYHCPPGRTGNGPERIHAAARAPPAAEFEMTRLRVARFRARQNVLPAAPEGTKKGALPTPQPDVGSSRPAGPVTRPLASRPRALRARSQSESGAFSALGKSTNQIDVKQAVFKARAGHMHVIDELEPALDAKPASTLSPGRFSNGRFRQEPAR